MSEEMLPWQRDASSLGKAPWGGKARRRTAERGESAATPIATDARRSLR
jgi:hypothetical protein